jgi:AraC family transcriptional regulator
MEPRIELLSEKKLVGKRLRMSLSKNKTAELWQSFMPKRKAIKNILTTNLFDLQIYDNTLNFKDFNQETEFEKWAAVEVSNFSDIPEGMNTYTLQGGLYAVFIHKGHPDTFHKSFHFIFNNWLPDSDYDLDIREHFEVLGDNYKNNDPESEEEVWIPIKRKL